jgi:Ala-tRNA(Pro) deacylase
MSVAHTLQNYMSQKDVHFDVLKHSPSRSSMQTAEAAHVPGDNLAKAVILEDDQGYVMAVVPATHQIRLGKLRRQLKRELRLAAERDFAELFHDCEVGAIPPLGEIYGMPTVVDDSLANRSDVYFEAGDHEDLIHMSGSDFQKLLATVEHGTFSRHI